MKKTRDKNNTIPVPTIRRLPLYLFYLKSLKIKNIEFVTAHEIAKELHIDPTQITKDFSCINVKGKTRVGYEIDVLLEIIEYFLGYHIQLKSFIVGAGNLGMALMQFNEFKLEGLKIIKGFDVATEIIGKEINSIKVFDINTIEEHYNKTPVDIGIITVPANQAQIVAEKLVKCGVKAIWNFSQMPISAPDDIIIENTSIDSSLAMIKWKLNKNIPLIYKNRIL